MAASRSRWGTGRRSLGTVQQHVGADEQGAEDAARRAVRGEPDALHRLTLLGRENDRGGRAAKALATGADPVLGSAIALVRRLASRTTRCPVTWWRQDLLRPVRGAGVWPFLAIAIYM